MNTTQSFVAFTLDNQKYALHLSAVEKIAQAAEIIPLPKAPDIVMGVINIQGRIVPVVNIRRRFQLPERDINIEDHFIVCRTDRMNVAILVDTVLDIIECSPKDIIEQADILTDMDYVEGVVKSAEGMILIHDLNKFLSTNESVMINDMVKDGDKILKTKKSSKSQSKPKISDKRKRDKKPRLN
jgi:purine-binding chemotaxis protein CheW